MCYVCKSGMAGSLTAPKWVVLDERSQVFARLSGGSDPDIAVKMVNVFNGAEFDIVTRFVHPNLLGGCLVSIDSDFVAYLEDGSDCDSYGATKHIFQRENSVNNSRPQFVAALAGIEEIRSPARFSSESMCPAIAMRAGVPLPTYLGLIKRDKLPDSRHQLLQDIASGLGFMHRNGYIHGDVKDENVIVVGGRAQLADFGLSKYVGEGDGWFGKENYWQTFTYRRPVSDGEAPSLVSYDYWAFGVLVARIVRRKHPYYDGSVSTYKEIVDTIREVGFPEKWAPGEDVPEETSSDDWAKAVREICSNGGGEIARSLGLSLPVFGRGALSPPKPCKTPIIKTLEDALSLGLSKSLYVRIIHLMGTSTVPVVQDGPLAVLREASDEHVKKACVVMSREYYGRTHFASVVDYYSNGLPDNKVIGDLAQAIGDALGWRLGC